MNIYLFMGTNLPEIRQCLNYLARAEEGQAPLELHVPAGLDWPAADDSGPSVVEYDPTSVQWVFDPDGDRTVFILVDPRSSPVDQLARLAQDLRKCLLEPVKVVTCVDCRAAEENPVLRTWYEACIYYSDIVLLGGRASASKPFVREYQKQFERECYPCLFLFLKGPGNPDQPLEILAPDTRRLSQMFDLGEASADDPTPPGLIIESSCDLDLEEEVSDPYLHPAPDSAPAHVPDASPFVVYWPQVDPINP